MCKVSTTIIVNICTFKYICSSSFKNIPQFIKWPFV